MRMDGTFEADLAYATQEQLEMIYSKYQLMRCIKQEIYAAGMEDMLIDAQIHVDMGVDMLAQMALHKRCDIPTMVGLLMHHFEDDEAPAQACADEIHKMIAADFADWEYQTNKIVVRYELSPDVQARVDQFQYPLPMIEPPKTVYSNRQTGYLTIKGSLILKDNHHEDDICLDHINRVNSIPLTLNADTVAFIQNTWENLDHPKENESIGEYRKRQKAFEKYDRSSRDVLAALMAQGDRFWLTHKYDKRGRTYCQGYHVTYQGSDWNKACIEFADAEPLNEE